MPYYIKKIIALLLVTSLVGCQTTNRVSVNYQENYHPTFENQLAIHKKTANNGRNMFWSGFITLGAASLVGLTVPEIGRRSDYQRVSYESSLAVYWSSVGVGIVGIVLGIWGYIKYDKGTTKYNETLRLWIQYNNIVSENSTYTTYPTLPDGYFGLLENIPNHI